MKLRQLIISLLILCFITSVGAQSERYAEHSVLSSGDWYKIEVSQSGIHKLTYEQLVAMGVANPANVSVFGYGGAQLAEDFSKPYIDDLPQLSIYMEKGSDGVFGKGDYILFYAQGPTKWTYNTTNKLFEHEVNTYSNHGYYFVTSDYATPKYITAKSKLTANITTPIISFDDYYLYEKDEMSLINVGRIYLCDQLTASNLSKTYSFNIPNLLQETAVVHVEGAYVGLNDAQLEVATDGVVLGVTKLAKRPNSDVNATNVTDTYKFTPKKANDVTVRLKHSDQFTSFYLDFLVLNVKRKLTKIQGEVLPFRVVENLGNSENYTYQLSNINSNIQIWDVTNQVNIEQLATDISGTSLTFVDNTTALKEYVAVDVKNDKFLQPQVVGKIINQDLHALGQVDMVIISPSDFVSAANRLAQIHLEYDGITTYVVEPDIIYNEFSSGTPDATAYRRFMKCFMIEPKHMEMLQNIYCFLAMVRSIIVRY